MAYAFTFYFDRCRMLLPGARLDSGRSCRTIIHISKISTRRGVPQHARTARYPPSKFAVFAFRSVLFPHFWRGGLMGDVRLFRTWCAFPTHIFAKCAPFPHVVRFFRYTRLRCARPPAAHVPDGRGATRGAPAGSSAGAAPATYSLYTARGAALRASERSGGKHCAVLVAGLWLSLAFCKFWGPY